MPVDHFGVIRGLVDAINDRDPDAFVAAIRPDVEWIESGHGLAGVGATCRGRTEVRGWFEQTLLVALGENRVEIEELAQAADGSVLTGMLVTANGQSGGVETGRQSWNVARFLDGSIARGQSFRTRDEALEALEAVGLAGYDALTRAVESWDVEALVERCDPEVEWHSGLESLIQGRVAAYRGHEGVREWFRTLDEAFTAVEVEISELREIGDRVVATGRIRFRGRASDVNVESPLGSLTEFEDGKIVSFRSYLDPGEALGAAGLGEPR